MPAAGMASQDCSARKEVSSVLLGGWDGCVSGGGAVSVGTGSVMTSVGASVGASTGARFSKKSSFLLSGPTVECQSP